MFKMFDHFSTLCIKKFRKQIPNLHWRSHYHTGVLRVLINIFVPNAPFRYPLKTSENLTIFLCFQGLYRKGTLGTDGLRGMYFLYASPLESVNRFFTFHIFLHSVRRIYTTVTSGGSIYTTVTSGGSIYTTVTFPPTFRKWFIFVKPS